MTVPTTVQVLQAQVSRLSRLVGKQMVLDNQYGGYAVLDDRHNNILNMPYLSAAKLSTLVEVFTKGVIYKEY
jgi:hypothetical protein